MNKPIIHITVKDDQHGNPPSTSQLNAISRKFRDAIAKAGDSHVVVVTNERVKLTIINN